MTPEEFIRDCTRGCSNELGASASEELEIEIERWYDNEASEGFENVLWEDICECARHFANWQKQQMMKEAVSRVVHIGKGSCPFLRRYELAYDIKTQVPDIYEGDKVKLIVVKED